MDYGGIRGLVNEDIGEGLNEKQQDFNTLMAMRCGHN